MGSATPAAIGDDPTGEAGFLGGIGDEGVNLAARTAVHWAHPELPW